MSHVVLLGGSIFDNRAYVAPQPEVADQLRTRLGNGWTVTLLVVDSHVTADVAARQLGRVPMNARAAFSRRLPLIDLRLICSQSADYANPIEPSATDGDKIAGAIAAMFQVVGSAWQPSTVWT